MEVAVWYVELMAFFLASVLAEEHWKVYSRLLNLGYDSILWCWCRMMRHTGDPIYYYQPRRYR
jgi:hypothetical protein